MPMARSSSGSGGITSEPMPSKPQQYCSYPRCPTKVDSGRCPAHRRPSRHERGYTNKWDRYSKQRLSEHPYCVGYPTGIHRTKVLADVTDHILSAVAYPEMFDDPTNHQSLCHDCNKRKAIELEGGLGR